MGWLDPEELQCLLPAEMAAFPSPIPTQPVSSDECMPGVQTAGQREFEARVKQYGASLARQQGMSRRAFFATAAGMAAAFVATAGYRYAGGGTTDEAWRQIEALRRLEIPEDMQKQYKFQPLGLADGPVKTAILGGNNARLYKYPMKQQAALEADGITHLREQYAQAGSGRSNRAYGYIRKDDDA